MLESYCQSAFGGCLATRMRIAAFLPTLPPPPSPSHTPSNATPLRRYRRPEEETISREARARTFSNSRAIPLALPRLIAADRCRSTTFRLSLTLSLSLRCSFSPWHGGRISRGEEIERRWSPVEERHQSSLDLLGLYLNLHTRMTAQVRRTFYLVDGSRQCTDGHISSACPSSGPICVTVITDAFVPNALRSRRS
jgi:hypothetical protein